MPDLHAPARPAARLPELEHAVAAVEARLALLTEAIRERRPTDIESLSGDLHRDLVRTLDHARRAARQGGLPPALRRRVALATGQVAAQREALARANHALDRALDVLFPADPAAVYGAAGQSAARSGGMLQA